MLQYLIVALIVGAALAYSVWVLLPAGVRGAAAVRLAGWAGRSGMGEKTAQRLQSTLDDERDFTTAAEQVRALMFVERFAQDVDQRLEALGQ